MVWPLCSPPMMKADWSAGAVLGAPCDPAPFYRAELPPVYCAPYQKRSTSTSTSGQSGSEMFERGQNVCSHQAVCMPAILPSAVAVSPISAALATGRGSASAVSTLDRIAVTTYTGADPALSEKRTAKRRAGYTNWGRTAKIRIEGKIAKIRIFGMGLSPEKNPRGGGAA